MSDVPLERIRALVNNVQSHTRYDCLTIDLRSREFDFAIEFASFPDGEYYNVCNLPARHDTWLNRRIGRLEYDPEIRHRLTANTALPVADVHPKYVQFAVEDAEPESVADDIAALAEATAGGASVAVERMQLRVLTSTTPLGTPSTKEVTA